MVENCLNSFQLERDAFTRLKPGANESERRLRRIPAGQSPFSTLASSPPLRYNRPTQ